MSFETVKKFEDAIADFYGAPYAVATDCCTHAIELCLRYTKPEHPLMIPNRTYISIPFTLEKLGLNWAFHTLPWSKYYSILDTNIIDAAVFWEEGGYEPNTFMCLSFQHQKHLSLGRGGMILTDNKEAAEELKKMSYDGRTPDKPWREQNISSRGYHYYMTPETAQRGLQALEEAKQREPRAWQWEDWPDLQEMSVFKDYNEA